MLRTSWATGSTWLPRAGPAVSRRSGQSGHPAPARRPCPRAEYTRADIPPFFWPNGKNAVSEEWKTLAADGFKDYRLEVYGLVENPVELSLDEIRAMGEKTQITLHHCIQGWSGIAEWGGLQMLELMKLVRPLPDARGSCFTPSARAPSGGQYYDSHTIENMRHPQALLAYEMNYQPLNAVHGAPLRLRVETSSGSRWSSGSRPLSSPRT